MGVQGELKRVEMHVCLLGFYLSNGHFVHSLLAMASGGHALLIPHPPPPRHPRPGLAMTIAPTTARRPPPAAAVADADAEAATM